MPIYEYRCTKCEHRFDELVRSDRAQKPACPECASKSTERLMSVFAARATEGTPDPLPQGGCGRCGDPNGPCQM